jgi:N6-L-threonylcarbamoyladenine synthase
LGSLLVGLSFAKAFAWSRNIPYIAVDHMLAHLYAPRLAADNRPVTSAERVLTSVASTMRGSRPEYPFLGLLVSGGHTIICRADNFDDITVMGTTIDDAVGEAFDKVAKFYNFGYPGGKVIDDMSHNGDSEAFRFPMPSMHKVPRKSTASSNVDELNQHGVALDKVKQMNDARRLQPEQRADHRYDVSYSGLKTAAVNQLEMFRVKKETSNEDIAASFQKTAVEILLRALLNAARDTGLTTIVAGGGVAAKSYLRSRLAEQACLRCIFPPLELCGDNAAMVAGIGYQYLARGEQSPLDATASARVTGFKKKYP